MDCRPTPRMRAWNRTIGGHRRNVFRNTLRDVSSPEGSVFKMAHSLGCWEACIPKAARAIPKTSLGAATENDWFATQRDVHAIDMTLAMDFQSCSAGNPFAAKGTECGKPVLPLQASSGAAIYMLPSVLDRNANAVTLAI